MAPTRFEWQGHSAWCLTQNAQEASFDELAFLRAWHAWQRDPQRPTHLHVLAYTQAPLQAQHVLAAAQHDDALQPLAQALAAQCWGLLPGIHRLRFEGGHVCLTLCVGAQADWPEFADLLQRHPTGPCVSHALPAPHTRTAVVVGGGIAGAGTARALAERGWQVTVLDAGNAPAAGASGLPVGVVAPHTSYDDSGVSRLSRAGLRYMAQTMQALLVQGQDWAPTGVRERRLPGKTRRGGVPTSWLHEHASPAQDWTRPAPLPSPEDASTHETYWHPRGAWLRPAQLVRALLDHPHIHWQGQAHATALRQHGNEWQVLQGEQVLAQATRVVIAAGPGSVALANSVSTQHHLPIKPLRGQISWGLMADVPNAPWPATPVNGHGSLVHSIDTPEGPAWFAGSTFDRITPEPVLLDADHQQNLERLQVLEPATGQALQAAFAQGHVRGWAGMRCGVHDRLPVVGAVPQVQGQGAEGVYINAAMGSRGLTLGLLCGEVLAAQWHGEPLPIEARLAKFLDAGRFVPKP
jgi:tRNA 5-methylaminomethyl-2-thiouridine biosynthesis bifunctional protein